MFYTLTSRMLVILIPLLAAGVGCNSGGPADNVPATGSAGSSDHDHAGHDHAGHDHSAHDHASGEPSAEDLAKVKEALAKLSPEDAAAVEKQKICPVSNELLGSMGTPLQVDAQGTAVWICCEGCRKPVETDPAKFVAKIKTEATP